MRKAVGPSRPASVRRLVGLGLVLALVVPACGGGDDTGTAPTAPSSSPADSGLLDDPTPAVDAAEELARVEATAAMLVAELGDEDRALVAVLLATDRGYSLDQIVGAAATHRLGDDGSVASEDGNTVEPEYPPSDVFVVAAGFAGRSRSAGTDDIRTLDIVEKLREHVAKFPEQYEHATLITLLLLLHLGFSLEQIVLALTTDGVVEFEAIRDRDGVYLVPARPNRTSRLGRPATSTSTSTSVVTSTTTVTTSTAPAAPAEDPDAAARRELVAAAVGTYRVADDVGSTLQSIFPDTTVGGPAGEMVVEPDGTVSGSLWYSIRQEELLDDGPLVIEWHLDLTLAPAGMAVLDDGLTFDSVATFDVSENGQHAEPYEFPFTGHVDVELDQIVLGLPLAEGLETLRFER